MQAELLQLRRKLANQIEASAEVVDVESGYIVCENVNWLVDPELLRGAAEVTRRLFLDALPPDYRPQKVLGVSNRGKEFGTALGLEANLPIVVTERKVQGGIEESDSGRLATAHYDPRGRMVTIDNIPSFTRGVRYRHILHRVEPGDQVLVVDDFCAYGNVAEGFRVGLEQIGVRSTFAFLVAKDFPDLDPPQTGYRRLREDGIPAFAVTRLTEIKSRRVVAIA